MTCPDGYRLSLLPSRIPLFPGGSVNLRVYERRHLDLVRDCARHGTGFGVCLLLAGDRPGQSAVPAAVGTSARIIDFYSGQDGLLGIVVAGERRFRVEHCSVRDNGLILGRVAWLPDDPAQSVPARFGLLSGLLRQLLERFGGLPEDLAQLDDAAWVAWRLAERLPLQATQQQGLLQIDAPEQRLARLTHWLSVFAGD